MAIVHPTASQSCSSPAPFEAEDDYAARAGRPLLSHPDRGATVLSIVLLISVIAAFVPVAPSMPRTDLDSARMVAMNQVVAQGLKIGDQIIFTFGPYASAYSTMYHPSTDALMLTASLFVALGYWIGLVLLIPRLGWIGTIAFSIVLTGVVPLTGVHFIARDGLYFSYFLLVICACFNQSERRHVVGPARDGRRALAIVLLFAPMGVLPLVKGSFLVLSTVTAVLCCGYLLADRRWRLAIACLSSMTASTIVFWSAAGQQVEVLPLYLGRVSETVAGYTEAMQITGPWRDVLGYVVASTFLLAAVVFHRRLRRVDRAFLATGFGVFLFVAFKSSFVRHDVHVLVGSSSILLAALILPLTLRSSAVGIAIGASVLFATYIEHSYLQITPLQLAVNSWTSYANLAAGISRRVADRKALSAEYERAISRIAERVRIPRLDGTADIYSFEQVDLIASGNAWSPRPTIQSYVAYSEQLARINRDHLLSVRAPGNLVFKVEPIDDRLPALEDGASWPVILRDYRPVQFLNGFLILRHEVADAAHDEGETIVRGVRRLGETVIVPEADGPIFARMQFKPTPAGHLVSLLYKPPPLRIVLKLKGGRSISYRIISSMTSSGFLLSPAVEKTEDFALLYIDAGPLDGRQVTSFIVSVDGPDRLWKSEYDVELIRQQARSHGALRDIAGLDRAMLPTTTKAPASPAR